MKKIFSLLCFFSIATYIYSQDLEQFNSLDASSSYSLGTFVSENGILWKYVNSRGNQQVTQNRDKAISFNKSADACLVSDTIPYGIKKLSFLYEQTLSTNCEANVYVNDSLVGTITTETEKGITKVFEVDLFVEGNFVLKIQQASDKSGQITIDDIFIQYIHTPFIINDISITNNEFVATFSHTLSSGCILADCISKQYIRNNQIVAELEPSCGICNFELNNIVDTAYEQLRDTTISHFFYEKPSINDVVITEIMAKPSPVVGLPDYEYVEIFNATECSIQCSDLQLVVGNTKVQLPDKELCPNGYYYIISEKALIEDSSHCVFVKNFPSITNAGQTIALLCGKEVVSSVLFTEDWYEDSFKSGGGWSLEKRDVHNFSETKDNWGAVVNRIGGTPGKVNSIVMEHVDTIPPKIENIQIVSDSVMQITFSENIDINNDIQIKPHKEIIAVEPTDFSLSKYRLLVAEPFVPQCEYTLIIPSEMTDFAGNYFENDEYVFAKTDSVLDRKSVIINEILFNPSSGKSDFVELYNNSNSYFDLSQLYLSNGDTFEQISSQFQLFPPNTYVVISPDAEFYKQKSGCLQGIYITSKLPTMPDEEGTVILYNRWEEVIESVSYSEKWHSSYITDNENVSLERLSFNSTSESQSAWISASATSEYSTPGCKNSQAKAISIEKSFSLESNVITPNGDGENDECVFVCGNTDIGTVCTIRMFSSSGRLVKQVCSNHLLGESNVIRWNCTNAEGNLVNAGIYIAHIELLRNGKKISGEKICCTVERE